MSNYFENRYYRVRNIFKKFNRIEKKQSFLIISSQTLVDFILAPVERVKLLVQSGKIKSGYRYFINEKNYKNYWRGSSFYIPRVSLYYIGIEMYYEIKKIKIKYDYLLKLSMSHLFLNFVFLIEYLRTSYTISSQINEKRSGYTLIPNSRKKLFCVDFKFFFKTYFISNIVFSLGIWITSYVFIYNLLNLGFLHDGYPYSRAEMAFFNLFYFPLLIRTTSYPFEFIIRNMAIREAKQNNMMEKIKIKKYFFRGFGYGLFKGSLKIILWTELINFITKNDEFY